MAWNPAVCGKRASKWMSVTSFRWCHDVPWLLINLSPTRPNCPPSTQGNQWSPHHCRSSPVGSVRSSGGQGGWHITEEKCGEFQWNFKIAKLGKMIKNYNLSISWIYIYIIISYQKLESFGCHVTSKPFPEVIVFPWPVFSSQRPSLGQRVCWGIGEILNWVIWVVGRALLGKLPWGRLENLKMWDLMGFGMYLDMSKD